MAMWNGMPQTDDDNDNKMSNNIVNGNVNIAQLPKYHNPRYILIYVTNEDTYPSF